RPSPRPTRPARPRRPTRSNPRTRRTIRPTDPAPTARWVGRRRDGARRLAMDPRAGRRMALLLIAAPVALAVMTTFLIVHGPRAAFPSGRTAAGALVGHVDAPLAVISCDELPVKPPDPDEMRSDE